MRYIALILCLMLLAVLPASSEAELCFSRENAPYWHKNPDCHFAETDWMDVGILGEETCELEVNQAESEGQKPCPCCATAFAPTFTGDFPDWPHPIAPWDIGTSETWVSKKVREKWGDPAERIKTLCPERIDPNTGECIDPDYPDDYAGLYVNAAGGYTLMIVDPTSERVSTYRRRLNGEFWVLYVLYGWETLRTAQNTVDEQLDWKALCICSTGVDVICNRVVIGVYEDLPTNTVRIRGLLAALGYDSENMFAVISAADTRLIEDF